MIAKILVIDDDPGIHSVLIQQLQKIGHNVLIAGSGREGIEVLIKEKVDLVLLDHSMPEMDGLETFERIKNTASHLPVIMMTARSSISLSVEFMKAGGKDFVEKPVDFEILNVKIRQALEKADLQAKLREAEASILAAKQASRLKGTYLSSVNHKLISPLNAIVVYVQSLQIKLEEGHLEEKHLKEGLRAVNKASRLLTELINDVLDFSKIEAG